MRNSNALKVDIQMRYTYGRYIREILYKVCKTVDNSCETVDNFGILSYKVCKTVDNSCETVDNSTKYTLRRCFQFKKRKNKNETKRKVDKRKNE